jgi:hypothetical protein
VDFYTLIVQEVSRRLEVAEGGEVATTASARAVQMQADEWGSAAPRPFKCEWPGCRVAYTDHYKLAKHVQKHRKRPGKGGEDERPPQRQKT